MTIAAQADTNELDRLTSLTANQTVTIASQQRELCEARQRMQDGHERLRVAGANIKRLCDALESATNDLESCTTALAEAEADNARLREMLNRQWQPIETAPKNGAFNVLDEAGEVLFCFARDGKMRCAVEDDGTFPMPEFLRPRAKRWMPLPAPSLETDGG